MFEVGFEFEGVVEDVVVVFVGLLFFFWLVYFSYEEKVVSDVDWIEDFKRLVKFIVKC